MSKLLSKEELEVHLSNVTFQCRKLDPLMLVIDHIAAQEQEIERLRGALKEITHNERGILGNMDRCQCNDLAHAALNQEVKGE